MNKRVIGLGAALALLLGTSVGYAQTPLENTTGVFNAGELKNVSGYTQTEDDWMYVPSTVSAAEEAIADGYTDSYTHNDGVNLIYVTMEGNLLEGDCLPMLNIKHVSSTKADIYAVSMETANQRYNFRVSNESTQVGRIACEYLRIPLNSDGIAMIENIAVAKSFTLTLHGSKESMSVEFAFTKLNNRDRIQNSLLKEAGNTCAEFRKLGGVASENRILAWEEAAGFEAAFETIDLKHVPSCSIKFENGMYILGDKETDVKQLEQQLVKAGYLFATADSKYDEITAAAVKRVQTDIGRVPTGAADAYVMAALEKGNVIKSTATEVGATIEAEASGSVVADAGTLYTADGICKVKVDSYSFLYSLRPSCEDAASSIIVPSAKDKRLIVFEGELQPLSGKEVNLAWDYEAEIVLDGKYTYDCNLTSVREDATAFSSLLLPLEKAKFFAYAEVPAELASYDGEWTLNLKLGDTTLTYTTK